MQKQNPPSNPTKGDVITVKFRCNCGELLSRDFVVESSTLAFQVHDETVLEVKANSQSVVPCPVCLCGAAQIRLGFNKGGYNVNT